MTSNRRSAALSALQRLPSPLGQYINGQSVRGSGQIFPVFDPTTGEKLGDVHDASEAELDAAVSAAKAVFP